jgi:histidinol phosphatase-like enzyme (inositol monophosphatase family)
VSATAELRELLEVAVEIAWRAGRSTMAHYQAGVRADAKADGSPVTVADRDAERLARSLIAERFPGDGILGEEQGETGAGSARRWVIDPIDGTRTFVRGVPFFGFLLGLLDGGEPVLGVAYFPALGETLAAARGCGCWWNGNRATVSPVGSLEEALVVTTDVAGIESHGRADGWDRLRRRARMVRTWGDCYGYALVATGRAEAMLDPVVAPWDVLPFVPILAEAGGVLTDWPLPAIAPQAGGGATAGDVSPGAPWAGDTSAVERALTSPAFGSPVGSAVATNAALDREVRSLLVGP